MLLQESTSISLLLPKAPLSQFVLGVHLSEWRVSKNLWQQCEQVHLHSMHLKVKVKLSLCLTKHYAMKTY